MVVRLLVSEPPQPGAKALYSRPFDKPLGPQADPEGGKVYDKGSAWAGASLCLLRNCQLSLSEATTSARHAIPPSPVIPYSARSSPLSPPLTPSSADVADIWSGLLASSSPGFARTHPPLPDRRGHPTPCRSHGLAAPHSTVRSRWYRGLFPRRNHAKPDGVQ